MLKIANETERNNLIKELLPDVFDEWATSMLRSRTDVFLKRSEVVCS